jgi:small-conductance mechanosensitive channel
MSSSALTVKGVAKNLKPLIYLESFGEWTVGVRMYYFTEEYENLLVIQGEVGTAVYKAIADDKTISVYWPRTVLARFASEADTSLGPGIGSGRSPSVDQA